MRKKIKCLMLSVFCLFLGSPVYAYKEVSCGKIHNLPYKVLQISNLAITIMQVAVPVILVLLGSIDLLKAVSSQKEDEIKKAQGIFIKRLIMGALVFFVVVIVKLITSIIGGNSDGIWKCVECFVSGANKCK